MTNTRALTRGAAVGKNARMNEQDPNGYLERQWDVGQRHLAAGRYVAARRALESAEGLAWRRRDAGTLARIYLPLMEARRQIRQNAVEGMIVITAGGDRRKTQMLLGQASGTLLIGGTRADRVAEAAREVGCRMRQRAGMLEVGGLLHHGGEVRLVSGAEVVFAGGLAVRTVTSAEARIDPRVEGEMVVPLPPAGVYGAGEGLQGVARESLVLAWEALALKWQGRHSLNAGGPSAESAWREMAWLRGALAVDPACEPAAMRLISLAEAVERQ